MSSFYKKIYYYIVPENINELIPSLINEKGIISYQGENVGTALRVSPSLKRIIWLEWDGNTFYHGGCCDMVIHANDIFYTRRNEFYLNRLDKSLRIPRKGHLHKWVGVGLLKEISPEAVKGIEFGLL